jgi:hypothetical protein
VGSVRPLRDVLVRFIRKLAAMDTQYAKIHFWKLKSEGYLIAMNRNLINVPYGNLVAFVHFPLLVLSF